jgi:hypothetical protein
VLVFFLYLITRLEGHVRICLGGRTEQPRTLPETGNGTPRIFLQRMMIAAMNLLKGQPGTSELGRDHLY